MPAVKYDYDYNNQYSKSGKGVAKSAMPYKSSQKKTSPNSSSKKIEHRDIDIPVMVKKKVVIDQKPETLKLNKPKTKANVKQNVEGVKRKILLGFAVVATLFMICMRYTEINEKFNEVNSLERELNSAKSLNQQLSANIDSKTDLSYIEKYAKYQLGMQKPTDSQIVRIAYEKHDKISTPIIIEEEKEKSFFEKLFFDLKNLAD